MNRKNKKAWLKVLEAVIAITLLIGFLLYIMSTSAPKTDISGVANEKEMYILDSISQNNTLRSDILNGDNTNVNFIIAKLIPVSWDFRTRICDLGDICNGVFVPNDRDVYSNEVVVSSNNTVYQPKKFRLFVWVK